MNESLKEQIEEEINNKKCYEGSEERIKAIKERIEKTKMMLSAIKEKMKKLEEAK